MGLGGGSEEHVKQWNYISDMHRKAGIKHSAEEKTEKKEEGKRIEMESEAIKNGSAAYLSKK